MWYMPYLRVRHAVLVYAWIAVGISLVAVALRYWPGVMQHMDVSDTPNVNVSKILAGAAALVGGLATVLGLNLAAENDGHLEVAWTKPVSREGYALGVFAVDIAAMLACILFTALCGAVILDVYSGAQVVTLGTSDEFLKTLAFFGFPLCVYAWITAISASLKRNRGTAAGVFWPVMFALGALQLVPIPAVHAVAAALDVFNPVDIYTKSHSVVPSIALYLWGWAVAAMLLAAALVQWRRLQL